MSTADESTDTPDESAPQRKGDASRTKRRIAETAARLFAERGFTATSIREVLDAAGVSAPTLYYHFGSKDGLIEAIVVESLETFVSDVADVEGSGRIEEALVELTLRVFRFGAERPEAARLIAMLDSTPLPAALRERTAALQTRSMASIVALFDQAREAGDLPSVDAAYCATAYVGLVMFQLAARAGTPSEQRVPLEADARRLARFVVAGARGASTDG
ncbi:MAG: TetR/AcrR family transcriptional regulator [Planctomycetota bacterium]